MEMEYCAQRAPQDGSAGRPTGFRRLTPGLLKANRAADAFTGLPDGVASHGQLLAAFKAAAPRLGLSIRLVHAVDWLFRFTQAQDWETNGRPIVWPSAETQQSALGLSLTQVKAINRMLIESGLLTMRDSPNGKRYGRRDRQGRVVEAYGFDLAPLAARHAEFVRLAEEEKHERQLVGRLRRRITIARKGIVQILETAREYGLAGDEWTRLVQETQHLLRMLKAAHHPEDMEAGVVSLECRQTSAREHLELLLRVVDSAPREPENRPHNIATNENPNLSDTVVAPQASSRTHEPPFVSNQPSGLGQSAAGGFGLKLAPTELIRLAPRLQDYLHSPDPSWPEVVDAADWLRSDLDISKPLWGEACVLLGREAAAVAVAIVSTKPKEHFKTNAAGYFHGMVAKAKAHELNLERTIWKLRTAAASQNPPERNPSAGPRPFSYPYPQIGAGRGDGRAGKWQG